MKNNYNAALILYVLGDTIGFKNGEWKFNYSKETSLEITNEILYDFIGLGGVNGIDLSDWITSDKTLYNISMCESILKYNNKLDDKFYEVIKSNLIQTYKNIIKDEKNSISRYSHPVLVHYINKLKNTDGRYLPYDPLTGTNDAATRNISIGLAFHNKEQLDTLIELSINSSKLTNNSPYGYLASLTISYFISLGIQEIDINQWVFMLIDLLESDKVRNYINTKNNDEMMEYISYIRYWKKYLDTRFVDTKPLKIRATDNLLFRLKYYYENFVKDTKYEIGVSGISAVIMTYDSLIDCDGKWEKLICYSMIHAGDSNSVGALSGCLYGILYGFGDVPSNMLKHIEFKDELNILSKKLYKRFFLNENV